MQHESVPVEPEVSGLVPFGIGLLTRVGERQDAAAEPAADGLVPFGIGLLTDVGAPRPPSMDDSTTHYEATSVVTALSDGTVQTDNDARPKTD